MAQQIDHEVIVVGGGITGLSAAWYLQQAGLGYALIEAQDRWGGKVISNRVDHAAGTFIIDVDHDTISNVSLDTALYDSLYPNYPNYGAQIKNYLPTLGMLFVLADIAIENGADEIECEFDATYHFITELNIDFNKNAVDDEQIYRAYNFIPPN